jgi:hypothetical protein
MSCLTRKRWVEMTCLWDVVEERSASGSFRACLFERSEFAGPPLARVPQSRHEVPDVQAGQLRPTLARCGAKCLRAATYAFSHNVK